MFELAKGLFRYVGSEDGQLQSAALTEADPPTLPERPNESDFIRAQATVKSINSQILL